MAKKPRRPAYAQDHYYHLYNRGASRVSIFQEDDNYYFVLGRIKSYCREFKITPISYCLMPNHYHFLVRQDGEQPAGLLVQRVFNSYSKAYNKRYGHSGTLFQGPYKVIEITKESHLRHLCRYIHANPVKDGLVRNLEDWPYSNYHEYVGLRNGNLYDPAFVADIFGTSAEYQEFVVDYLITRDIPVELVNYLEEV